MKIRGNEILKILLLVANVLPPGIVAPGSSFHPHLCTTYNIDEIRVPAERESSSSDLYLRKLNNLLQIVARTWTIVR